MAAPGRIALVGGVVDEPAMRDVVQWLAAGRTGPYVQVLDAVGIGADRVVADWAEAGARTATELGLEHVVIRARTRADADADDAGASLQGAGIVAITAQTSENLVRTLAGTRLWRAIVDTWRAGAALAADGPAAMALCGVVPAVRGAGRPGLGLLPDLRLMPDVDSLGPALPHSVLAPLAADGGTVVGLDGHTALTADGPDADGLWAFRARGRGSAWLIAPDRRRRVLAPVLLGVHP